MIAEKHMWRRSDTFYWRRRMTLPSTGTYTIQVSLRTTDRREAAILARRLTVESDQMFAQLDETGLTPQQMTIWLRTMVDHELRELRVLRIRAAVNTETSTKSFDMKARQMVAALKYITTNGFGYRLDTAEKAHLADVVGSEQVGKIEKSIFDLAAGLSSSEMRHDTAVKFRKIFGDDTPLNETIVSELILLMARATAEVWSKGIADTDALHGTKKLSQLIESAMEQSQIDLQHDASTLPSANLPLQPSPRPEQLQPVERAPILTLGNAPPEQQPLEGIPVDAVIESLIQRKSDDGVRDETVKQYRSFGQLFTLLSGVTDVRQMTQADLSRFDRYLRKLPKTFGKSSKDKGITLEALLARSADLPKDQIGLAAGTHNRHINHLNMFLQTAEAEGYLKKSDYNTDSFNKKDLERARDKRVPFERDDIEKITQSPIWTGSKTKFRRHVAGKNIFKDSLYWMPIIAAHSGARRGEIAGLRLDEIKQLEGIWCFDIKVNENRGLKNAAAARILPIHPRLIELGLLDHVEMQRKNGVPDLFPEQRTTHQGQRWGDGNDYNFSKALEHMLDGNPKEYCFHSFRHYVIQQLKLDKTITTKVRHDLGGHEEGKSVSDLVYGGPSPVPELYEAVCNLPVVF